MTPEMVMPTSTTLKLITKSMKLCLEFIVSEIMYFKRRKQEYIM